LFSIIDLWQNLSILYFILTRFIKFS
jgi:hypothetical protein